MTTMWITRNILVVIFLCHEGKPDDYNKQAAEDLVDWGQWGACTGSCGLGHRSRTGCHKFNKQGAKGKCLPSSTEETGACSLPVLCSSSSKDFPGQLTSSTKSLSLTSSVKSSSVGVLPFALPVTLQPSTPQLIKTISMTTANGQRKPAPIATSSTSMMTSSLKGTFREKMQTQTVSPATNTSPKPAFVSDTQSSTAKLHKETQNVSECVDKQGVPRRSQAHFSVEKDKILLSHTIDEMWASNEVKCAMLCLRNPHCKSFNFQSTMGDTRQENDSILGQDPKNCLLNAAMRLTFTEDLVVRHGWTYFYRTT
ncbi:uncharacterized protein LOC141875005 isoform X2 [Acropora palmata]|uniref:uncharacterized protein LOC141875005 isoform X2 n=1 Tax=Acropora palmata TaxID=6131 RepID=UPI003DA0BB1E